MSSSSLDAVVIVILKIKIFGSLLVPFKKSCQNTMMFHACCSKCTCNVVQSVHVMFCKVYM